MEKRSFDVRHNLVIALGYNKYLHEEIDKVYEKNRLGYYEAFKNSGLYNDMVMESFTAIQEEKMKKVAGIVEWSYKRNDLTLVENLIKKGYKDVLRYYQQNKKGLSLEEFSKYISKRKGGEYSLSELDLAMYHCVLIYIAYKDKYNVNALLSTPFGRLAIQVIEGLILNIGQRIIRESGLKEDKDVPYDKVIEFVNNTLKINMDKKFPANINILFDFSINQGIEEKIKELMPNIKEVDFKFMQETRSNLFFEDIYKYIGGYTDLLKMSGLNYDDLLNIEINKDDLVLYAYSALRKEKENNYSPEEIKQHFIASLFMHCLFQHYNQQKKIFIDDTAEKWYLDIKNREEHLEQRERFYKRAQENIEGELKKTKEKNKEKSDEITKLKKEIERLNKQVDAHKEEKEELVELRNFAYNQPKLKLDDDAEPSIKEAAELLSKKKIIVCGGHSNMQRKLKEWLPNLDTLSTETLGKSFSYLTKYDAVYFYPNYANHSFYKKIKSAIANSNTKFVYLPDVDNMEKLVINMYENI